MDLTLNTGCIWKGNHYNFALSNPQDDISSRDSNAPTHTPHTPWEYTNLYYKYVTLLYNQNCFLNHSQYYKMSFPLASLNLVFSLHYLTRP